MIAGRIRAWVTPVKAMFYLAVIGGYGRGFLVHRGAKDRHRTGKVASTASAGQLPSRTRFKAASANAQERALRDSLAQTPVVISNSGGSLELWYPARLAFVPDGMELLPAATAMLDLVAHSLREFEHSRWWWRYIPTQLAAASYNQQQSQDRADAVVAYLEAKGVSGRRLAAKGPANPRRWRLPIPPRAANLNRRLQVVITPLS